MFNFIFNALTAICYPVVILLICMLTACVFWKRAWSRYLLGVSIIALYLSASGFIPNLLVKPLERPYRPISLPLILSHHALIVLGGGLSSVRSVNVPMSMAYARVLEAYRIYHVAKKHGVHYHIYASGGDTSHRGTSEAQVDEKILEGLGVPAADITCDNKSHNTYQNAEFLAQLLKPRAKQTYVLVTSALHMTRSLQYFHHFGFAVIAAPSDYPAPNLSLKGFPFAYNVAIQEAAIHEYLGIFRMSLSTSLF